MADFDFSGVDALSQAPAAPAQPASHPTQSGDQYDFSGVDAVKDYGTPTEMAKTAAEQGLSGLTLGLSKVAETKGIPALGIPPISTPEAIAAREEENPAVATASNVGGALVGLLGPEEFLAPVKGIQMVGRAAEAALGGGRLAKVAGAAVEGALFGGINQATDDWSQDKALDAGKIAASAGIGALLGGGGAGLIEAAGAGASKVTEAIDALSKYADKAATGEGYVANIFKAYQAAGESAEDLMSKVINQFENIYKAGKTQTAEMFDKLGGFHLNAALEDMPLAAAQRNALETGEKVKSLITTSTEAPVRIDEWGHALPSKAPTIESNLSPATAKVVSQRLDKFEAQLNNAQTAREVHDAMSKFATDLDKGGLIKFDKLPTASQQADQEILRSVREAVRGDLKNPDMWGDAAGIYSRLSDRYSNYLNARKNFERDFMKNRIGPAGKTIKVIDPSKVKTFFKAAGDPVQKLKQESMDNFIRESVRNSIAANNHAAFMEGVDGLIKQVGKHAITGGGSNKALVLKALEKAKQGHKAGFGSLALLEFLPKELSVPLLALNRYATSGGDYMVGNDLYKTLQIVKTAAKTAEAATDKIDRKARLIFTGSGHAQEE